MMKKIFATAIILLFAVSAKSQWINSISHVPINPTATDTIYFFADISFPSGSCDQHTQFSGVLGQHVYAGAVHCLGMLTFICDYTDTFKINPLQVGNYYFVFNVEYGGLPSPCTVAGNGAVDSIAFTVSSASSDNEIENGNHDLFLFPNPANSTIKLQMSEAFTSAKNKSIVIYSLAGNEIRKQKLENSNREIEINISDLSNGIYFCNVISENSVSRKVKLVFIK